MRSRYLWVLVLALLLGLFSVACTSSENSTENATSSGNPIVGIEWQWLSVSNRATSETTTVPDPENYTIIFNEDGSLSGKADCNNFTGTYSQESGFAITLGATTTAACGPDSLDQQYLSTLSGVAAGGPDGSGGLALETAGGEQRMEFQDGGSAN